MKNYLPFKPSVPDKSSFKFIKKAYNKWVGISLLIIFSTFLFWYFMAASIGQATLLEFFVKVMPQKNIQGTNILVFGIDETDDVQRADSIMVFHVDEKKNRLGAISIPRDTRVKIPGFGLDKVNHSYAHGGTTLLRKTVSEFLSIPIDYYVKIQLKGVEKIIDDLGGISMSVDKDMYYVDKAGDLYIDLKKGTQNLSGKQAIQYLRFRQDHDGDIGRINRQQSFVRALSNKASQSSKFFGYSSLIRKISKNLSTDMGKGTMMQLSVKCNEIYQAGRIETATIPGVIILDQGVSYWRPDIISMDKDIEKVLFGFDQQETIVASKIKTADTVASQENRRKITINEATRVVKYTKRMEEKPISKIHKELSVEVLNGNGIPGEAQILSRWLKSNNHKVARFGNAGTFDYDKTLIVDWHSDVQSSIIIAQALSIDPTEIILYDRPNKPLDITIVIGRDWEEIKKKVKW